MSSVLTPPSETPALAAKHRWKILARALTGDKAYDLQYNAVSVRRFQSFGLFQNRDVPGKEDVDANWFTFSGQSPAFSIIVRHLKEKEKVTFAQLLGFNNTGNVCIWPSEEVMTHHCLKNIQKWKQKSIIELGGGMTCLAGLCIAATSEASNVVLTDGNEDSINNLKMTIASNNEEGYLGQTSVSSWWGSESLQQDFEEQFDFVLCADCFFFEEGRSDLVDLVYFLLKDGGEAVMFAPHRGHTLQAFVDLAKSKFSVMVDNHYDETIWSLHEKMKLKGLDHYDENIHYPIQVILKKGETETVQ